MRARRLTRLGKGNMGRGKVMRRCTTPQVLQSGLAFGLFLCAHAGYHIKCNLRILYLLELEGTWVRQKVDKRCGPWTAQNLIDPYDTSNSLLQELVGTLKLLMVLLVNDDGWICYCL